MGLYISVSGILTFKTAQNIRDVIRAVPLDRLLVETDAPYLAPQAYRGARCEPSMVEEVIKKIAELKNLSFAEVEKITTENAKRLFNIIS